MIREIGQYEILERIGAGGFGEVFLAQDRRLGRRVAIKILPELMRVGGPADDPAPASAGDATLVPAGDATVPSAADDRRERFYREARAAAALDDPHVVTIYEVGDFPGGCFIVMEYLQGKTMKKLLEGGLPPIEEVCEIGLAVCRALDAAHRAGIVHRDIKAENVMRTEDGRVKVLDFGLARQETAATITRSGDIMGTPAYMPPEQALGEKADARSDIYSLGVVLYEMLTGRLPFGGSNPVAVLYALVNEEPPRPREVRPAIPEDLERIVLKAMMKDPERRYASAPDLGRDLSMFRDHFLGFTDDAALPLLATEDVYASRRRTFEPELAGREKPMARLRELLDEAFSGQTRAVMISGEAGIGKSRLVSELQQAARTRRALNLTGRCLFGQGAFPYQPLVDAMRRHLATLGVEDAEAFERLLHAEMPDLLPHERALRSFLHLTDEPLEESARREQLWEAYRSFLAVLSRQRPLTFLIEDLHWADESTLALALYLMTRIRESRLLFLGTYRPEEQDGLSEKLIEAVQTLSREDWFYTLRLERLGPEDVSRVVRSLFGEGLGEGIEAELCHETGGNPFFLLEMLKYLAQDGKLVQEDGRWRLAARWDASALPDRVLDLVMRRLEKLDETERDLIDLAAVQGEVFESDVLSAALGMNRIKLLKSLQKLEKQHHLIRPAQNGYTFDHATIRRALYESVNAELRGEYHLAVGRALAELHEGEPGRAGAIAHHLLAGGDEPAAVPHLLAAGRDARRVFANEEALGFLQRALEILDSPGGAKVAGNQDELRFEALLLLGDLDLLMSRHEDALASYGRLRDLARAAGRPGLEGAAEVGTGLSHYNRAQFARALESYEAAAERFRAAGDKAGIARALDKIGNVHTKQGRFDEALELHAEALDIRREAGDRLGEAESLNNLGIVYRNRGRLDEALEAQERAVALKRESGERRGTATSLINLGNVLLLLRRHAEALERYKEALEYCREIGDRRLMAYPLLSMGNTFFEDDDYDAASEHCRLALGIYDEIGDRWGYARALNNLGVIELRRADYGAALAYLSRSAELKRDVDDERSSADTLLTLCEVHRRLGNIEEARSVLDRALRITEKASDARLGCRARLALGSVAADLGESERAVELLRASRLEAAGIGFTEVEVSACAVLARALGPEGGGEALACLERGFEIASGDGNAHDRALAGLHLAAGRLAAADAEAARVLLEEAFTSASSHGFREIVCACRHLQTSIALSEGRAEDALSSASKTARALEELVDLAPADSRDSFISRGEIREIVGLALRVFREAGESTEAERLLARFSGGSRSTL